MKSHCLMEKACGKCKGLNLEHSPNITQIRVTQIINLLNIHKIQLTEKNFQLIFETLIKKY